jgi:DnaJ like chaperone protein
VRWVGKAIGAALGLLVGSYPGAVLGAFLGHQFDQGMGDHLSGPASRARKTFFEVTFEAMGHIAKVDGRVSEEEIQVARRIMHAMRLSPEEVKQAISLFTAGKRPEYPMRQRLSDLVSKTGQRSNLARAFVEIQVQAAVGAGDIARSKRELLWVVASSLGLNRVELAQIESMLRQRQHGGQGATAPDVDLSDAYKTLGVARTASDKEIKVAYRRLMNQHHPDKLVSKGLPESMTAVAEERTQEIRAAYDRVKRERSFK